MKGLLGTALVIALAAAAMAPSQSGAATLQKPDKDFLMKASEGNVAEIKLGELAVHKASNPQVKQFGQRMVDDHTKAQDELKKAMNGSNVIGPAHLTKHTAGLYNKLARESGAGFDKDYMNAMVSDHQEDITAFQNEAKNGKMEKLRTYAQNTLPVLQQHLQNAKQVNQQVAQNEKK